MHKRILVVLALLVLLSGVGMTAAQTATWTPTPIGQWCYRFPFATGQYGFSAPEGLGVYEGGFNGGFRQSVPEAGYWGQLTLNYTHTVTVFPSEVELKLRRGGFTLGPIDAQIAGNLFGLEIQPEPTLFTVDPEMDVMSIVVSPVNADDFSNQFTLYLDARQYLYVTDIYVRGFGVNPFGSSNCIELDHPPAATSTPTITVPAPTQGACLLPGQATPTPDITPGPSPTPSDATWHFVDTFDSVLPEGFVRTFPHPGGGVQPDVSSGDGNPAPAYNSNAWGTNQFGAAVARANVTYTFPAPVIISNITYQIKYWGTNNGMISQTNYVYYNGTEVANMRYSAYQGLGTAIWVNKQWLSPTQTTGATQITFTAEFGRDQGNSSYLRFDNIEFDWSWEFPPTQETPTPWPNCTLTPTVTPSISPTPTASPTPFTLTPTFTRTPTRTPFPIVIPTTAPTNTPAPTTTAGPPTATLHPSITPTGTVGPFEPIGGISGDGGNGGLRGLGNAISALGSNVWQRATGWVGNMTGTLGRFTSAWNSAAPTALPGMPMCKSDPLANELCAIWFILTFTVFSGTLGSLIVPTGISIVDIFFLFLFIRMVRAILHQAKQIRS